MQKRRNPSKLPIATLQFHKNDFPDPKIIFLPGSPPSSSRHRKRRNPIKSQQSLVSNFRKMIFPTRKSFFFRAARQAAVDTVKEEIPANPSNRHSPISEKLFPRPKNHFFPGSLPSSSRQRKKGEIPANPSNRFRNVIFPTQKSFFARTPQKKKSQQIPATATLLARQSCKQQ